MKHEQACTTDPEYDPYITLSDLKAATADGRTVADLIIELSAGEFEIAPIEIADGGEAPGATVT